MTMSIGTALLTIESLKGQMEDRMDKTYAEALEVLLKEYHELHTYYVNAQSPSEGGK